MHRLTQKLLLLVLVFCIAGCTAKRYLEAGDAAFSQGDARAAVYNYQRAMNHQSSLVDDPAFMRKVAVAESRAAYQEATRLDQAKQYEQAIRQLRIAQDKDPGFVEAERMRLEVIDKATRWHYEQAIAAADRGDLHQAHHRLSEALRLSAGEGQQSRAMASLSPESLPADTPGLSEYLQGVELASSKRWPEAQQRYEQAIAENPNLLPARAMLFRANQALKQANQRMDAGQARLARKQLAGAIREFESSLEYWPHNEQAQALLWQAQDARAQVVAYTASAEQAVKDGDWDQAIASADAGLALDASDSALAEWRAALPARAAAYYSESGGGLLAQGRLDQAEADFRRSIDYVAEYPPAIKGLAEVHHSRGEALEAAGRLGAALLVYRTGLSTYQLAFFEKSIARVTAAIQKRIGLGVDVAVDRPGQPGLVDPKGLNEQVAGELSRGLGDGLAVNAGNAPFALRMTITGDDYSHQLSAVNRHKHRYQTVELRDNPEFHQVLGHLHQAQGRLDHAKNDLRHAAAEHDALRRHADRLHRQIQQAEREHRERIEEAERQARLEQERKARLERERREAKLRAQREREAAEQARRDKEAREEREELDRRRLERERRRQAERERQAREQAERQRAEQERARREARERQRRERAERQRQEQQKQQEQQRQRQRQQQQEQQRQRQRQKQDTKRKATPHGPYADYEAAKRKLHAAEQRCDACRRQVEEYESAVRKWKRRLANTPRHLEIIHHHEWPYTVETHTVTGWLTVKTDLVDTRTGQVIDKQEQQARFSMTDDLNLNPNPEAGLPVNRLRLADEGEVAAALIGDTANKTGPWAVNLAVQQLMDALKTEIDKRRKAGKDDEALEAEVDLAILLGAVDPEGSEAVLKALAARQAR